MFFALLFLLFGALFLWKVSQVGQVGKDVIQQAKEKATLKVVRQAAEEIEEETKQPSLPLILKKAKKIAA